MNVTENDRRSLDELLELIKSYNDVEMEAFFIAGRAYKDAKKAGYQAGLRAAQAQLASTSEEK